MRTTLLILFILFSLAAHGQVVAIADKEENVLYTCVENPFTIAVENTDPSKIKVFTDNGTITSDPMLGVGHYNISPAHAGMATIHVAKNGKTIDSILLKVRNIPLAIKPSLAGKYRGKISGPQLRVQVGPAAFPQGIDYDGHIPVTSFNIVVIRRNDVIFNKVISDVKGTRFDEETLSIIKTMQANDELIIKDISVIFGCGEPRYINDSIDLFVDDKTNR